MKTEAEVGVMQPQTKARLGHQRWKQGKVLSTALEGAWPCDGTGREEISVVLTPQFVAICCTAWGHSHAALHSTKLSTAHTRTRMLGFGSCQRSPGLSDAA